MLENAYLASAEAMALECIQELQKPRASEGPNLRFRGYAYIRAGSKGFIVGGLSEDGSQERNALSRQVPMGAFLALRAGSG